MVDVAGRTVDTIEKADEAMTEDLSYHPKYPKQLKA